MSLFCPNCGYGVPGPVFWSHKKCLRCGCKWHKPEKKEESMKRCFNCGHLEKNYNISNCPRCGAKLNMPKNQKIPKANFQKSQKTKNHRRKET